MSTTTWHRLVAASGSIALTLTACGADEPEEAPVAADEETDDEEPEGSDAAETVGTGP